MRNISILILVVTILWGGCAKDELSPELSVVLVENADENYSITVTSNIAWVATEDAAWFTLNPTSDTGNCTIVVSVEENTTTAREATITVKGGTLTETVTIQAAAISEPHEILEFTCTPTYSNVSLRATAKSILVDWGDGSEKEYTNLNGTFFSFTHAYVNNAVRQKLIRQYEGGRPILNLLCEIHPTLRICHIESAIRYRSFG
ncbi:hypothetical protein JCM10512_2548 [Bacteroides reticulotermitis JCM 10512]|uniref:BACON domain-containing protein n=1 Tax=Bacteroides reticulotermitis JCM 10512 TaxID=1445607 RepID=W4UUM5_9BACE|nr:hypothetical protein JCM10512_2548 [Bacteroides reticulotermitis JCM 10512]